MQIVSNTYDPPDFSPLVLKYSLFSCFTAPQPLSTKCLETYALNMHTRKIPQDLKPEASQKFCVDYFTLHYNLAS